MGERWRGRIRGFGGADICACIVGILVMSMLVTPLVKVVLSGYCLPMKAF